VCEGIKIVTQYTTGVVLLESDCWGSVSSNTSLLANGSFDRPPAGPGLGTFAALEFLAAPTPLQPSYSSLRSARSLSRASFAALPERTLERLTTMVIEVVDVSEGA